MPVIALRDATTTVPTVVDSTLLMQIDGIQGNCIIPEYFGWIALTGFEWGGTRAIGRHADRSGRMMGVALTPQMRAVQVSRASDFRSPEIWSLMLTPTKKPVEFAWLRTTSGGTTAFMKLALIGALITRMSEHSGGDTPEETIAFTYEELTLTVVNVGNSLAGPQDVISFRLPQAQRG